MKPLAIALAAAILAPILLSCDRQPTQPSENATIDQTSAAVAPAQLGVAAESRVTLKFDPNNFVQAVDNRLFPLKPGTKFTFRGVEDGETETNITIVTHDRKNILGISAVVVFDRVFVHGELKERTFDWYAQDRDGNVWYLGEDTAELEGGKVISTEGTWEAGKNGAKPGIIMLAHPRVTDSYRQEFQAGVAEDEARVVALDLDVTVPYGSFHNCIKTVEVTRLEPGVKESKVNCPGVGFVRAHSEEGPFTRLVLTNITQVSR